MVIVRIFDGLGNQLFQYAYARMLQEKNVEVYLDTKKTYEDNFRKFKNHAKRENKLHYLNIKIPEASGKDIEKYSFLRQTGLKERLLYYLAIKGIGINKFWQAEKINEGIKESNLKFGNVYLNGWFQNEEFFRNIRTQLLKELRPKKKIKINKQLRQLLQDDALIAVHIRRGDYTKINNTLPDIYYCGAFEIMKKKYTQPKYLFFSDDMNWVKEKYNNVSNSYFVTDYGSFDDYEELMIMSSCKSNIIANSTFSWWGAWLNQNPDKTVIAPKKWFYTQENIVPKDWIRV